MRLQQFPILFIFLCFLSSPLFAQVGVNNPDPEQTLDVNGKVKIGDDATAPSDGTMRFNDGVQDLEGYVDGEWRSLTKSAMADAPRPIVLASFGVDNNAEWVFYDRPYDYTFNDPTFPASWEESIPAGKILVIDQICVTQTTGAADSYFYASIRPTLSDGLIQNPQIVIGGSRKDGTTCLESERAPLLVVKNEGSIKAWNSTASGGQVRMMAYGFLVDNLDQYFSY